MPQTDFNFWLSAPYKYAPTKEWWINKLVICLPVTGPIYHRVIGGVWGTLGTEELHLEGGNVISFLGARTQEGHFDAWGNGCPGILVKEP